MEDVIPVPIRHVFGCGARIGNLSNVDAKFEIWALAAISSSPVQKIFSTDVRRKSNYFQNKFL
jgi:hypothetical protein